MRCIIILSSILAGNVFLGAQTIDTIITKVRIACNRIETFSADAHIYEYSR